MHDKVIDYYNRLPDYQKEIVDLVKQGRLKFEMPRQRQKDPYPFGRGGFVFVGTHAEFDEYIKHSRELVSCQSGDNDQSNSLAESIPGYAEIGVGSVDEAYRLFDIVEEADDE